MNVCALGVHFFPNAKSRAKTTLWHVLVHKVTIKIQEGLHMSLPFVTLAWKINRGIEIYSIMFKIEYLENEMNRQPV